MRNKSQTAAGIAALSIGAMLAVTSTFNASSASALTPERTGLGETAVGTVTRTSTVDCTSGQQPISSGIYGIAYDNMRPAEIGAGMRPTSRRLGGNVTTRFNYDINAWNLASDWFYENYSPNRTWQQIMDEDRAAGMNSVLTIPMIGYVAKDTTSNGFPVSVYGAQQFTDTSGRTDAGNGIAPNGTTKLTGDPLRTSVAVGPTDAQRWVTNIGNYAAASSSTVKHFVLDNEPDLWSSTHRDVHPNPLTMDEQINLTKQYSTAIKTANPSAKVAGPASWGVWGYLYSEADGYSINAGLGSPDRAAHGGAQNLPWYLAQMAAYDQTQGRRNLDLLDVHYYPQAPNVFSDANDTGTAALRLRSTRALWDSTYTDESWLSGTELPNTNLFNTLKGWINANYPGTGISIGEWNFGAAGHMSGGLAVAETLGQLGSNGIDSAYYWTVPAANSPAYWAFRAFRNYDGAGAQFQDISVSATDDVGSATDRLSVFAAKDSATSKVTVVALNMSQTQAMNTTLSLTNCGSSLTNMRAFRYSGSEANPNMALDASASFSNGTVAFSMEPYSISVLEFSATSGPGTTTTTSTVPSTSTTLPPDTTTTLPFISSTTTTLPSNTSTTLTIITAPTSTTPTSTTPPTSTTTPTSPTSTTLTSTTILTSTTVLTSTTMAQSTTATAAPVVTQPPQASVISVPAPSTSGSPSQQTTTTLATAPTSTAGNPTSPISAPAPSSSPSPNGGTAPSVASMPSGSAQPSGVVSGHVFNDTNRNGLLESTERGIPRAKVRLTLTNGQTLNVATDVSGFYEFSGLPVGDIAVQVMATTSPTNGSTLRQLTLAPAQQVTDVDYGFSPSAVKGVQLEADANGNTALAFTGTSSTLRLLGFALCLLGLGILLAPRRPRVVAKHKRRQSTSWRGRDRGGYAEIHTSGVKEG